MHAEATVATWRQAAADVGTLLLLTVTRTWWLLLAAPLLTWGMVQVPQGREFLEDAMPMGQALALLVSAALICIVAGAVAMWLVTSRDASDPIPAAVTGWFAAGLAILLVTGLIAWVEQAASPEAVAPRLVRFIGVLSAWFTLHIGVWQDQGQPGARATWGIWGCYVGLFGTVLWPSAGIAAAASTCFFLAGHVIVATVASHAYRPRPAGADAGWTRLLLAPLASGVVVTAGVNNAIDPVTALSNAAGPIATLTLALGFWIGACFLIVWSAVLLTRGLQRLLRDRLPKLPWQVVGTTCVFLVAGLLLYSIATGQMAAASVRRLGESTSPGSGLDRRGPVESTENWVRRRISALASNPDSTAGPLPVLIVAAEGGGVRAAYWTASVLTALRSRYADFGRSTLAVSGVSGGSVGMVVDQAVARAELGAADCRRPECPENARQAVQRILGDDFLSPALMSLLVGEPLRDMGLTSRTLDRAAALERGLEERYSAVVADDTLSQGLCRLQQRADVLMLPGLTDSRTGKRIVLACLPRETPTADITSPLWLTAAASMRASTAALLSARFPLVSPTGLLSHDGMTYRIVDGGFSDNSGAGTAVDVLYMVHRAARELGLSSRIRPIVLVISNAAPPDPDAAESALGHGALGMLVDPLATLDAVRARNASDYRRWLDSVAGHADSHATVIEWRLPHKPHRGYPLGWLLSGQTRDAMSVDVSQSMVGPAAKELEAATGWQVKVCGDGGPHKAGQEGCEGATPPAQR